MLRCACRWLVRYLPAANSPVGHARLLLYVIFGDALLQQLLDLAACLFGVCFACEIWSASWCRGLAIEYAPILMTAMPMSLSLALPFKVTESMGLTRRPRDLPPAPSPLVAPPTLTLVQLVDANARATSN